jgi:hypothetical protein
MAMAEVESFSIMVSWVMFDWRAWTQNDDDMVMDHRIQE